MKKYILFLLIVLTHESYSQNYDSLRQAITELTRDQEHIKLNLERSHNQFSKGTLIGIIGLGTALVGSVLYYRSTDTSGDNVAFGIMGVGGVAASVGLVIQIDSHKWIGRAGVRR